MQQNPLVNFGESILSESGLEAVANDKEGGYSLVDPEVLTNIHLQLLGNGLYFETDFTNWDKHCAKTSMSFSALCKRVEDLEQDPELARELRKSLSVPGAAIEVQLVTSCTSHKPPGDVKFRNIHSGCVFCEKFRRSEGGWTTFRRNCAMAGRRSVPVSFSGRIEFF